AATDPTAEANPQTGHVMTFVGIGVLIVRRLSLFGQYKQPGLRGRMVLLRGSPLLSTALAAPQAMIPFWLGLIARVWGIITGARGLGVGDYPVGYRRVVDYGVNAGQVAHNE